MKYIDYKRKMELSKEQYDYIDGYAREKPIDWSASVWDLDSLKFMQQYDIPFIKIPSALLTNKKLVIEAAKIKKPVILSTGMSTLEEIDVAVNNILAYNNDLIIMHTNSSYPAKYEDLNLNCIPKLRERYGCVVGYSAHEEDLEPTVIACVLGAKVVERHICLDHNMWGSDQKASLEVHAMNILRKRVRDINIILGDGYKRVTESEIPIREKLRR
jgi:N-acetylneuraminate synthase